MKFPSFLSTILLLAAALLFAACGGSSDEGDTDAEAAPIYTPKAKASDDPMENKGIGPVSVVVLGDIDQDMVAKGKEVYEAMCTACHKAEEKFIGPSPKGIMSRRSPEWVMNMILNPEEMVKEDPIAKKLLAEYNFAPMANQNLTQEQARQILEYFRTLN